MSALSALSLAHRIAALAACAKRWINADFPQRVRVSRALAERTGYAEPCIDFALDSLFGAITQDGLLAAIRTEIGDPRALEDWVANAGGGRRRYYSRGPAAIVASRTTIGVALMPAIFALLAGSPVAIKDRADRLCGEFFRTLERDEPGFTGCVMTDVYDGEAPGGLQLRDYATVVAFGGTTALETIRRELPLETAFYGFGPKISCGIIDIAALEADPGQAALPTTLLAGLARDAVLYDAEGCMSLHALFITDSRQPDNHPAAASLAALGQRIHAACEATLVEFPPGPGLLPAARSRAADQFAARAAARFRAAADGNVFFGDADPQRMAVYVDTAAPPLQPRMLPLIPVRSAAEIQRYCRRHGLSVEAVAVYPPSPPLQALAHATGAARIEHFGNLQRPQPMANHGGLGRLAPFIRRVDDMHDAVQFEEPWE